MRVELEIISRIHRIGASCAQIGKPVWEGRSRPRDRRLAVVALSDVLAAIESRLAGGTVGLRQEAFRVPGNTSLRAHHEAAIRALSSADIACPAPELLEEQLGRLAGELREHIRAIERIDRRRSRRSPRKAEAPCANTGPRNRNAPESTPGRIG